MEWWWVFDEIIFLKLGSQIAISASAPYLITPLWGYIPNIWAALVDVFSTNWFSEIYPYLTPFVQTTDNLSSTPFTPFGILLKPYLPNCFCSVQKVQLSVLTTSIIPLFKYFIIWVFVFGSGLKQGDITYLEATSQS